MAQAKLHTQFIRTLELSEEEVIYLRGLTQNYAGESPEAEPDRAVREGIFKAAKFLADNERGELK